MPVGVVLVAVMVFALGWFGPLAHPGYELALATGLSAPAVVAIVSALEQRAARRALEDAFGRALSFGGVVALFVCAMATFHGVRTGFCEPKQGYVLLVLGPMFGVVMASVWGLVAAELVGAVSGPQGRRGWTVLGALAGPVGTLAFGVYCFHATPMVFAYDPFVGFFSGSVYDTVLVTDGLWTYRLATGATLGWVWVLSRHVERRPVGLRLVWRGRPGEVMLGLAAGLASLGSVVRGDTLGHWQTASTIQSALGAHTDAIGCRVIHEPALREAAALLGQECSVHVRELSAWLGLERSFPIEVFLFRDAEQKRQLMGAAQTSIAKPWRREIYLQNEEFPHPVLRHELAHALASELARGPFRVAGSLGGWLPDPGLIEGLAEAAAPRDDELSEDEWAAAMRRLGLLPPLGELFGLGFFAGASSASYTAAGSFVAYVRANHGAAAIAAWYRGEKLDSLIGKSRHELEVGWWKNLDELPLTDTALAEARLRFDRPGIFARPCPHTVDRLLAEAGSREGGEPEQALALYRKVLELDPRSARALFGVASCHEHSGNGGAALEQLEALTTSPLLPEAARANAAEKAGDLALRDGRVADAKRWYLRASENLLHEDRLRTLELKNRYAAEPLGRRVLITLLVGTDARGPNVFEALDLLGEWHRQAPHDGVPSYLLGRQLANAHRWERAAERLDEALSLPLLPRVEVEALRLRIRLACAVGEGVKARELATRFSALEHVAPARKHWLADFVQRCP